MNTIKKLTSAITLVATTIGMVYGDPCYTNIAGGCNGNNQHVIHVKTTNTDATSCTEYIDEKNQKKVHCHAVLAIDEKSKPVATAQKSQTNTAAPITNSFNYTVTTNSNQTNTDNYYNYDTGAYNNGYNYNYGYGVSGSYNYGWNNYRPQHHGNNNHRPPPHWGNHHRPPPPDRPNHGGTLPSRPINNGPKASPYYQTKGAVPARPIHSGRPSYRR